MQTVGQQQKCNVYMFAVLQQAHIQTRNICVCHYLPPIVYKLQHLVGRSAERAAVSKRCSSRLSQSAIPITRRPHGQPCQCPWFALHGRRTACLQRQQCTSGLSATWRDSGSTTIPALSFCGKPGVRYSGRCRKRKRTCARSPERSRSRSIATTRAACLTISQ